MHVHSRLFGGCVALVLGGHLSVLASTFVSGTVAGAIWSKANSPYIVTGNVLVATLTVQPGVEVLFQSNFVFEVAGTLRAIGTVDEPIRFDCAPNNTAGWQGIFFNENQPGSELAFCRIERSKSSGIRVLNSTPTIRDCVLANNSAGAFARGGGIRWESPQPLVLNRCIISSNVAAAVGGGIYCTNRTILNDCIISSNALHGSFAPYGAGVYSAGPLEIVSCKIEENSATGAGGPGWSGGVFAASAAIFRNSSISKNVVSGGTPHASALGLDGGASLLNCVISENQGGPAIYYRSTNALRLTNCTFISDTTIVGPDSAQIEAINCIFWGNLPQVPFPSGSIVTYSDIQGGYAGEGNISYNPVFGSSSSFVLAEGSPCIDAGSPDPAFNDTCFPFSLGTARNDMGAYGGPGACDWPILPRIVQQPANRTTCVGRTATFSAVVTGEEPLACQWLFHGGDPAAPGNPVSGGNSATLTLSDVQPADAGYYSLVASNAAGTVQSAAVALTVTPACVTVDLFAGLTIGGQVGQTYRVEYSADPGSTNWTLATNIFQAVPDVFWLDPTPATQQRRFYRVMP